MQSDSPPKFDLNNDATTSRNVNSNGDLWAKDLENLEKIASFVTDENRFNQNESSRDKQSTDLPPKNCFSPGNLFNDCTNKSTENSNDKFIDKPGEKLSDKFKAKSTDKTNDKLDNRTNDKSDEDDEMNGKACTSDEDEADEESGEELDQDSDESDDEPKTKKSKKRRKKTFERRNIKKLIKEKDLDERVLAARKEEEERINRIIEQQKQLKSEKQHLPTTSKRKVEGAFDIVLSSDEDEVEVIESSEEEDIVISYERIQDELDAANSGLHTDDSLNTLNAEGRCLINIGHPSSEPDIYLDDYLAKKVKPHQIGGIRFMYDCIVENIAKVKSSDGIGGCILAHSMGLGKTLQVVAFTELYLRVTEQKYILCIVPVNTIQNWMSEYDQWLPREKNLITIPELIANKPSTSRDGIDLNTEDDDEHRYLRKGRKFKVYTLAELKTFTQRSDEIRKWRKTGGVLLMGYEMYRLLFGEKEKIGSKKKAKKITIPDGLSNPVYTQLMEEMKCSLIDPGPDLVICDEGHRIKNCKASISLVLKNIRTRRRIILTGYPLQNNMIEYWCMVDFIRPGYLGTKSEFANMFEKPITNGQCIDSDQGDRILARKRAHVLHKLLIGFVQRRSFKILFHTLPLKQEFCFYVRMTPLQKNLLLSFFRYLQSVHSNRPFIHNPLYIYSVCYKIWNSPDILARYMLEQDTEEDEEIALRRRSNPDPEEEVDVSYDWASQLMEGYRTGVIENSIKMVLLFKIIDETIKLGERILIFSQSLHTLDVIEQFLNQRDVPNDRKRRKFVRLVNYFRLDGSTPALDRKRYIDLFNKDKSYHLFLISTKAGSLGINLTGANRLIVFDISFNPCHDAQAVHRIYRYGQTKKSYVYRFIFDNSLEKRIFDRQITKQGVSNQVVDEINSAINVSLNEIRSLVDGLEDIEQPPVPKFTDEELNRFDDPIMRIICKEYNHCLTKKPLPHESLLAESEETKLSRAEKRIAEWEYNQQVIDMKRQNAYRYEPPPPSSQESQTNNYVPAYNMNLNHIIPNNQQAFPNQMTNNFQANQSFNASMPQQPYNVQPQNQPAYSQPVYNQPNYFSNSVSTSSITNPLNVSENGSIVPYPHSSLTTNQQAHYPGVSQTFTPFSSNFTGFYNNNPQPPPQSVPTNLTNESFRTQQPNPTIRNFVIPQNLKIKDDSGTEITLKKNQLVMLIQSENSLILRTFSGKQLRITGAFANFFTPPNQHNRNMRNHPPTATASNIAPEVIDLSDEE